MAHITEVVLIGIMAIWVLGALMRAHISVIAKHTLTQNGLHDYRVWISNNDDVPLDEPFLIKIRLRGMRSTFLGGASVSHGSKDKVADVGIRKGEESGQELVIQGHGMEAYDVWEACFSTFEEPSGVQVEVGSEEPAGVFEKVTVARRDITELEGAAGGLPSGVVSIAMVLVSFGAYSIGAHWVGVRFSENQGAWVGLAIALVFTVLLVCTRNKRTPVFLHGYRDPVHVDEL